jgi:uncharacterized protein (DUF1501 family)
MDPMTPRRTAGRLEEACCPEFAALNRRSVLRGALALGGATFMVGSATVSASASSPTPASAVLVVLSLRGGADGLSLVVPYGDPGYYAARPTIAIPQNQLLAGTTDGFFGLHPKLAPLSPLWSAGSLAAIHATGLTVANRSHFSAMEEVEEANPGSSARIGWLNRLVGTSSDGSPLQGVGIVNGTPPTELSGPVPLMTVGSLDNASIAADDQWDTDPAGKRRRSLHTLWDHDRSPMGVAVRSTLQATADITPAVQAEDNRASYGGSHLGQALASAARIIRGNVGTEVITVDQGDWDMHVDLGDLSYGQMLTNAHDLATSLAAFFGDLGDQADKVTLVTISEFGRRPGERQSRARPRLGQRHARRGGRGQGRCVLREPAAGLEAAQRRPGGRPPRHHRLSQRARRDRQGALRQPRVCGLPRAHAGDARLHDVRPGGGDDLTRWGGVGAPGRS